MIQLFARGVVYDAARREKHCFSLSFQSVTAGPLDRCHAVGAFNPDQFLRMGASPALRREQGVHALATENKSMRFVRLELTLLPDSDPACVTAAVFISRHSPSGPLALPI